MCCANNNDDTICNNNNDNSSLHVQVHLLSGTGRPVIHMRNLLGICIVA